MQYFPIHDQFQWELLIFRNFMFSSNTFPFSINTVGAPEIHFLNFRLFRATCKIKYEVTVKTPNEISKWAVLIFSLKAKLAAIAPRITAVTKSWKVMFDMVCFPKILVTSSSKKNADTLRMKIIICSSISLTSFLLFPVPCSLQRIQIRHQFAACCRQSTYPLNSA